MKKLSQSTRPFKLKERVADLDLVRGLYHQLIPALQAIALKPGGIQYYAHTVIQSEIFRLYAPRRSRPVSTPSRLYCSPVLPAPGQPGRCAAQVIDDPLLKQAIEKQLDCSNRL
jgi:hypothetical protein